MKVWIIHDQKLEILSIYKRNKNIKKNKQTKSSNAFKIKHFKKINKRSKNNLHNTKE